MRDKYTIRFVGKLDSSGDCWMWQAGTTRDGYGLFYDGTTTVTAHRHSYELFVGPIPEGYQVDHLCRTKGCVNPAHLEAVTPSENVQRHYRRKRAEQRAAELVPA